MSSASFPTRRKGLAALRAAAIQHLKTLADEMEADPEKGFACPILGAKVYLRARGIREVKRFSAARRKLKLIAGIRTLLEAAYEKSWEVNYKKDRSRASRGIST